MVLDLNKPIEDLDGKPMEGPTLAKLLSERLANSNKGPAIKFLEWAITLRKEGKVNIDSSDLTDHLKKFVEEEMSLTNLSKGRLLQVFNVAITNNGEKK